MNLHARQRISLRWRPALLLLSFALLICTRTNAQGCNCGEKTTCPRDIWMIETQDICTCDCDISKLKFKRLINDCEWVAETQESFLATLDPSKPINFQLPGYLTTHKIAVEHIWKIQNALDKQAACRGMGCANIRLVMWKWPAEKDQIGLARDLHEKAARAHFEGMLVAKLLAKFPKEMRVHFVAYSFGARIATSAAHHLVAEEASIAPAPGAAPLQHLRLRAVLIASAVDAQWLEYCQPHGNALARFEKVLIFTNCKDRLLRRYRIVNRNRFSPALGLVGLLMPSAEAAANVTQWEVSHIVGRHHDWYYYIDAPQLMSAIAESVFFLN